MITYDHHTLMDKLRDFEMDFHGFGWILDGFGLILDGFWMDMASACHFDIESFFPDIA